MTVVRSDTCGVLHLYYGLAAVAQPQAPTMVACLHCCLYFMLRILGSSNAVPPCATEHLLTSHLFACVLLQTQLRHGSILLLP